MQSDWSRLLTGRIQIVCFYSLRRMTPLDDLKEPNRSPRKVFGSCHPMCPEPHLLAAGFYWSTSSRTPFLSSESYDLLSGLQGLWSSDSALCGDLAEGCRG